ncbi:MAG TPA: hypothetical protein VIQ29_00860 [Ancylobacter sp.]
MRMLLTTRARLLMGAVAGCLLLGAPAHAAGLLTAANGMTVYTFDHDIGGVSSCYDACAANWPPYLAKTGETAMKGQTLAPRKDGSMQWAYDGKPLYFFAGDKKKGDKTGDRRGGVWHVVAQ